MIIKNVDLDGQLIDVRLAKGLIAEIGHDLLGEEVFDGKGGALLPGLHDHHIHLNATAAALNSISCGPPEIQSENDLINTLTRPGHGWIRGVGYHQSVAGEIDRNWLDQNGPERPVRIQHRSGRMWILNSLAMEELKLSEPNDGRFYDADLNIRNSAGFPDLQPLIQKLISYGITGATEVTPSNSVDEFRNYLKNASPLRLTVMGKAELSELGHDQVGPLKLHYHDHDLPLLENLVTEITAAHNSGRNIAAHCVTRAELMLTLAAIEEAGPLAGDRIEHAAIADDAVIDWMVKLGVIVVTQPNFIAERIEAYRTDVPVSDHRSLWRLKSFADAGLKMAAGSDAPFGDPNPWAAMHAAVNRPFGFEHEAITPEQALALYTKPSNDAGAAPRKIELGEIADLCLLDRDWSHARSKLCDIVVGATWVAGKLNYFLGK